MSFDRLVTGERVIISYPVGTQLQNFQFRRRVAELMIASAINHARQSWGRGTGVTNRLDDLPERGLSIVHHQAETAGPRLKPIAGSRDAQRAA